MAMTICSTLSGKVAVQHPTLGILVREDGAVFIHTKARGNAYQYSMRWTFGSKMSKGYLGIKINGVSYRVHRLVAEAFIPNPENKPTVDHWNRNTADNRVSNLSWATYKEQVENSGQAEKRKYGVRKCDDPTAYAKAQRAANLEQYREYAREYKRKYYAEHPEQCREQAREYQRKKLATDPEYRRKRLESHRKYDRKRRAAKKQEKARRHRPAHIGRVNLPISEPSHRPQPEHACQRHRTW